MLIRNLALAALVACVGSCADSPSAALSSSPVENADLSAGEFASPFAGDIAVNSVFDHDLPFEFTDNNGYLLSFWGERVNGIDGHNGYDWLLAEGTPVLASGPGTVRFADAEPPFLCKPLSQIVSGLWVTIAHQLTDGRVVLTWYGHLSRIDVRVGQRVSAGQQLGLSGTTGCSTGPHLHFSAFLQNAAGTSATVIDPYGWQSSTTDPWGRDARGVASFALWSAKAPLLFRELRRTGAFPRPRSVAVKAIRYLVSDDAHNPNSEFVEIDVNPDLASWDFGGATMKNGRGDAFIFPPNFRVAGGESVRIYSGVGSSSATALHAGRSTPLWDNGVDCMLLVDSLGRTLTAADWGSSRCGVPIGLNGSTTALPLDASPAPRGLMLRGVPRDH